MAALFALALQACSATDTKPSNHAAERWTPIELGIWSSSGAQMIGRDANVFGLRLGLPLVTNADVIGLDLGIVNNATGVGGPVQVSLLTSSVGRTFVGIQLAGLISQTGEIEGYTLHPDSSVTGVQIAGVASVGNVDGVQISFVNGMMFHPGVINGLQLGGGNSAHRANGVQVALSTNATGEANGAQVSGLQNLTDTLMGVQVAGLRNVAESGVGLQVSLVNRADEFTGIQIGLVNSSKKGLRGIQFGLWNHNEAGFLPYFPIFNIGF